VVIRITTKLKRIDRGRIKIQNLLRSVRDGDSFVKVGLLGSKKSARSGEKLTNAKLAIMMEYGTPRAPARPFIGPAFQKHRAEYAARLRELLKSLVNPGHKSYTDVLNMLGLKASADFKNFVTQGSEVPPPNAPSTLAKKMRRDMANWEAKGRRSRKRPGTVKEGPVMAPRTLVDTGRMVGAISHVVVRRSALALSNRLMSKIDSSPVKLKPKIGKGKK
jgi:hypothetical protein